LEGLWHVTPSPTHPLADWQVQAKDPVLFEHVAYGEHPPLFVAHSFTSTQVGWLLAFVPSW
jgi:hypothetical protein